MDKPTRGPHLVPANLIGQRFARDTFGKIKIALVGYCPPPAILAKYKPVPTTDQYFIHLSPASVSTCSLGGIEFLSLVHVYGGPVSSSTVEELAYYGIDYILAYGLAGGLGTKELQMNDFYLVDSAFAADGTTPHYTDQKVVYCDQQLKEQILTLADQSELSGIQPVRAATGDAIYQEDDSLINEMRNQGCDIVNLDSAHLYAASKVNNEAKEIRTIGCGVISDVTGESGSEGSGSEGSGSEEWESELSAMLTAQDDGSLNPLELTSKIVEFYIEQLAPTLV